MALQFETGLAIACRERRTALGVPTPMEDDDADLCCNLLRANDFIGFDLCCNLKRLHERYHWKSVNKMTMKTDEIRIIFCQKKSQYCTLSQMSCQRGKVSSCQNLEEVAIGQLVFKVLFSTIVITLFLISKTSSFLQKKISLKLFLDMTEKPSNLCPSKSPDFIKSESNSTVNPIAELSYARSMIGRGRWSSALGVNGGI